MNKEGRKVLTIMGSIVFLLCITFSGCTTSPPIDKAQFVGTWNDSMGNYMTFTLEGTYSTDLWLFGGSGRWDMRDGKLVFEHTGIGGTTNTSYGFSFSNNFNQLALESISGYTYQFTKTT
jgi:hypothetical protein